MKNREKKRKRDTAKKKQNKQTGEKKQKEKKKTKRLPLPPYHFYYRTLYVSLRECNARLCAVPFIIYT